MQYRHLGNHGIQVSVLSFGSWVSFGPQLAGDSARESLAVAYDGGMNFFDNAEVYSGGQSESIMGDAIAQLGWPRNSYVISSKYYWGIEGGVNTRSTLNRKYLLQAVEASLRRMHLDFLDLIFCHRSDPDTPIEETVYAMHDIIERGRALYWGTSEWSADDVREAWDIADRHHLHKPAMEQPQYNLLTRYKVEQEFAPLYDRIGLGLTIWSPLASGLLTGKYNQGIPAGSRAAMEGYKWLQEEITPEKIDKVKQLQPIAGELGCTLAQLGLAWCLTNPNVSTVITGASRAEQVTENMKALDIAPKLAPEILERIEGVLGNKPE